MQVRILLGAFSSFISRAVITSNNELPIPPHPDRHILDGGVYAYDGAFHVSSQLRPQAQVGENHDLGVGYNHDCCGSLTGLTMPEITKPIVIELTEADIQQAIADYALDLAESQGSEIEDYEVNDVVEIEQVPGSPGALGRDRSIKATVTFNGGSK